jgi:hypothetical protein
MSLWVALLIIFLAGAVGGVVNALISDNGFILPRTEQTGGNSIIRPGFLGNILIGGVAACVSWGLYGPFAAVSIVGGPTSPAGSAGAAAGLLLSSLVGAVLVGVGGARWLTNEVDKKLLRAAAGAAATTPSNSDLAAKMATATPAGALRMAMTK